MDVLVVAGEASGDAHAAEVVTALQRRAPGVRFFGMGGPKLEARGVELLYGAHELSVMGFTEVLPRVPRILRVLQGLTDAARARRPKVALLVDVPDFNLRLAARLKALGISVVYYVAPMAWAWREGRTRTLARLVDTLCCILPFEEAFFRERGVNAVYVGNPTVEQLPPPAAPAHFRAALGLPPSEGPVLAVLPGSRRGEINRIAPTLAAAAAQVVASRTGTQVLIPVAPGLDEAFVAAPFLAAGLQPRLIAGRAPEVVGAADVALVTSGTATLEAGLMRRPLVCVYRASALNYLLGRALVRLPFFCLVNLLAGRRVVPELLQGDATATRICAELEPLWAGEARASMLLGLEAVRTSLGEAGAAERVAQRLATAL